MVGLQNSTNSCNISTEDTQKWKSAYANSTFTPELKAGDNNQTLPFHQKCSTTNSVHIINGTHCPTTLSSTCTLMDLYPKNSTYPFSLGKNTTETCACVVVPPYTILPTSLNCTCTHDWKQNATSPNQTTPYLFSKDCHVNLREDNSTLNMNCTFKDCRYNSQAHFFNVTLNPAQSCNDTVANTTSGSTAVHSTTTPAKSATSSAVNSSAQAQTTTVLPSSKLPTTSGNGSANATTSEGSAVSISSVSAATSLLPTLTSTSTHQSRVESQHASQYTGESESTAAVQSMMAQHSASSSSVLSPNSTPLLLFLLLLFQLFVHYGLLRKVSASRRKQKHD